MLLIFLYFVLLALFLFVNVWAQQGYSKTCNIKYYDKKSTYLEIKCSLSFEILHQYVEYENRTTTAIASFLAVI